MVMLLESWKHQFVYIVSGSPIHCLTDPLSSTVTVDR